jgi:F-type H+-transporting ATPase subunit delta
VAEVTTARPLSTAQAQRLADKLSEGQGRRVQIDARVDPSLIGGLVVKLGSKMIDTSVRARLGALQTIMKEA